MLDKRTLQKGLKTKSFGRKLFVFNSIDSTNACARTLAEAGAEEGTVVIADFQTQGRGRLGRTWISEPGANLLFSIVLRPSQMEIALLPFSASVAVARAIEHLTRHRAECKWPNDVLMNNRKVCGILIETTMTDEDRAYAIIGIGINANQRTFPSSLSAVTSIALETGKEIDRSALFKHVLREFEEIYRTIQSRSAENIMSEWRTRCSMLGHRVIIRSHDTTYEGVAERLSDDGGLVLLTEAGEKTFYAGDTTVISS